jgi:hypothetical protein
MQRSTAPIIEVCLTGVLILLFYVIIVTQRDDSEKKLEARRDDNIMTDFMTKHYEDWIIQK